jgi:hypothetical protein
MLAESAEEPAIIECEFKDIWAELPKHTGKSVPPPDDEMLAAGGLQFEGI